MSVLRKSSFPENLETYAVLVSDTAENSIYFKITDLPDTFSGGKNSFLIQGSDDLVQDTLVKIEIKDSKGNVIYTEPGEGIPEYYEGTSKPVAVYVYPDTAYGPCTITILAELGTYINEQGVKVPIPTAWKNKYNIRWQKTVNVNPSLPNASKIRFYRRPKVNITETILPVYTRSVVRETISGSVQGVAVLPSANSNLRTYKGNTVYELYATSSIFSASMEGETITITDLNQSYSSQINDVVNDKKLITFVPYYETSSNATTAPQIVKNFSNGSFELTYNKSISYIESSVNTSYAKIKLTDLEAFSGDPARLKIFAKRKADIGNFTLLEDIQLEARELLKSDLYSGSVDVNNGILSSQAIIDDFWIYSNYARDTFYTKTFDNTALASSVKLLDDGTQNVSSTPQRIFYYSQSIDFTKDTEYQLDFVPLLSSSLYTPNKIEVYLSGSAFFNPANNNFLGKKIITLSADSIIKKYDLQQVNFKPESDGTGKLLFAVYQGNWQLSNISLEASQETNFSPNEITLNVSLPTVVNDDEYEFKFEFYDINNNYVPVIVTKDYKFVGGSNLSNVNVSASFLAIRPDTNVFPFGYLNNYDFQEVNTFASIPIGTKKITFNVTKPGLTGNITFTSAAFDSGGVYIQPSVYSGLSLPYPGLLTDITTDTPYLSVENFTGSIANIEVKKIEYTASLGGFEDRISIFKVVEGTPGSDGVNGTQYVITPVSGTAIKNSDPNSYLELQLQKIDASTLSNVTSGNIKLVTGSLNTPISVGNGITAGTNGVLYNPKIYAQKIDGILTVGAYDFDQNILVDTITLADITDGLTTGFIEASDGLILKRNPTTNTYTPTTTALTASFYDSKGIIYSESILITPNYSSPNDQLKYQVGINDSNINLDYVKTVGGVTMVNNVYTNTQGLTAKFTFTEPNTGQQISINEGVVVAIDGANAEQYVIRPISGTAIKNSDPNAYLEVQITKIDGTTLTDLSSGNIKLVTGSLNTIVNAGNGVTAGTNGVNYNARFYASKINGSLTVGAYDTGTSTMLDTITLADITDGLTTGYIESSNGLILGRNPNNTYTPSSTALTASFLGSNSTLYSASVLISASYNNPNDQLTYTAGYSSPAINLESVKTDTGTTMTNGVANSTKNATVKYRYTDPNTSDVIYVSETVAVAINGKDGSNGITTTLTPPTQVVTKNPSLSTYSSPTVFYIQVFETGSALTYTSTNPPASNGEWTLQVNTANGTNNSVNATKSGSIQPPAVTTDAGLTSAFSYRYKDSNGNLSGFISASHVVGVVVNGENVGDAGQNTVNVTFAPPTQTVRVTPAGVYGTALPFTIYVDESGSLMTYTASDPPVSNGQWTIALTSGQGTNNSVVGTTSGSITPPSPTTPLGSSSSFAIKYKNSKGKISDYISQSYFVGTSLDGVNGPGVVFTGVWESGRFYQFDSGSAGRRDVVLWSRNGSTPYNTYYGNLRNHVSDGTTTSTGNGAPNYSTGSLQQSAWLELGQQSFFVAAKIGLFEDSYVQSTLNIGTTSNGGISSANITLYGGNSYPYISLGQSDNAGSQTYGSNGIFLGAVNDGAGGRRYKFSIVTGSSYLKWDGYGQLQISGAISASEGRIGGVTISGSTIYAGFGAYNNSNTGFYLTSASSNIFSLGDKLTWNGTNLFISGAVSASAGAIGGVTINTSSLYIGTGLFSGSTTPFFVSSSGRFSLRDKLVFEPQTGLLFISGAISASAGAIGGIIIDTSSLYIGTGLFTSSATPFFVSSSGRFSLKDAFAFEPITNRLFVSGAISASAGQIGPVNITTEKMFIGTGDYEATNTAFFVSSSGDFSLKDGLVWNSSTNLLKIKDGEIRINATGQTSTIITAGGLLSSQGSNVQGNITATSGQIGGWSIVDDNLEATGDTGGKIKINADRPSIEIYSGSSLVVDISADTRLSSTGSVNINVSGSAGQAKISSGSRVVNTGNIASNYSGLTTATFTTGSNNTFMTASWSASFVIPQSADGQLITLNFSQIAASGSASSSFNALVESPGYLISDANFSMKYGFALYSASTGFAPPFTYIDRVSKTGTGTNVIGGTRSSRISGSVQYDGSLTLSKNLNAASYSVFPFVEAVTISVTATEPGGGGCGCPSAGTIAYYGDCVLYSAPNSYRREVWKYNGTCDNQTGFQYNGCDVYLSGYESCSPPA